MKRLSIKTRITLWYTGFMILLVAFSLVIIFIVSGRISSRQTEDTLRNVVTDVVSDISFRYGEPDTEDIDFYRDGVSVFIYDTSGRLLAPRVNMGVQVDSVLQDQRMRKVENAGGDSMVYDIYAVKDDNAFWVRGISSMAEAACQHEDRRIKGRPELPKKPLAMTPGTSFRRLPASKGASFRSNL